MWLQDTHCADGASEFDKDNSRALVALGTKRGRETCVEVCKHIHTRACTHT